MEEEIWKPIKGFEGLYEVSNMGRVRSVDRIIIESTGDIQHWKGKILKGLDNGRGYKVVNLRKNGKRYVRYIHIAVMESFVGIKKGMDVNHKDFNKANNRLDNLEYCTRLENIRYSKNAGHYDFTERSKKTEEKTKNRIMLILDDIMNDKANGMCNYKICSKYHIDHRTLKKYAGL